jgi:hypothetical protein
MFVTARTEKFTAVMDTVNGALLTPVVVQRRPVNSQAMIAVNFAVTSANISITPA